MPRRKSLRRKKNGAGRALAAEIPEAREKNEPSIFVCLGIGVPPNRRFILENPIKMDDLGVPPFLETPV